MTICFLNPAFLVHKIDFIYYKSDEIQGKMLCNGKLQLAIEEQK